MCITYGFFVVNHKIKHFAASKQSFRVHVYQTLVELEFEKSLVTLGWKYKKVNIGDVISPHEKGIVERYNLLVKLSW